VDPGRLLGETLPRYSKLLDDAAAEYNKLTASKAATKDQKDAAYKKYLRRSPIEIWY
jgi:hypothetical protein